MVKKALTKAPKAASKVTKPNWVTIEVDFRAGIKTLRQIGSENNISHVAIANRAKRDGWTRDLAAQIRARAETKVTKAAVNKQVTKTERGNTEEAVVEASAVMMATTILRQRSDVRRLQALATNLVAELELEDLKASDKKPGKGGEVGKREPVAARAETLRKVVETSKSLINLERVVLNIAPDTPIDPTKRIEEAVDNGFAGLRAKFDQKLAK